jgi:hypothetical protein
LPEDGFMALEFRANKKLSNNCKRFLALVYETIDFEHFFTVVNNTTSMLIGTFLFIL